MAMVTTAPLEGGAMQQQPINEMRDMTAAEQAFELVQREAKALAASSLVPQSYQKNIPNCMIALEMAHRIGASVFAVMQNLDIIHGRPGFRSTFLIGTVNQCGRFTPLRFRWEGKQGTDTWGCRAVAKDKESDEECLGTLITVAMSKAEGWWSRKDRNGKETSKWQTMPEQMLQYRAAAFWTRLFAPELSLGMQTREEIIDVEGYASDAKPPRVTVSASAKELEDALLGAAPEAKQEEPTSDGELPMTDEEKAAAIDRGEA